jgi:cysteine peptidase C11 family protein
MVSGRMRLVVTGAGVLMVAACGGGDGGTGPDGNPPSIAVASGDGQTGRINSALSTAPTVIVKDGAGTAVASATVTFAVESGGGLLAGSTATTNANGIATMPGWTLGPAAGTNSVSASVSGVAQPAHISATARLPYWTVLVYMAADNNLAAQGVEDLEEMEAAGADPEVQVIVQAEFNPQEFALRGCSASCIGRPNFNTFRYAVAAGTPRLGPDGPVVDLGGNRNMTSTAELREFITWGQQQYPAERTLLILWDHGGGYRGLLQDVTSAGGSLMSLGQMQPALTGLPIEIVGFDMCLMAGYETLESITGLAKYAAFSEEVVPGAGFPYTALLDALQAAPTADSRTVAGMMTSTFNASYQGQRSSTTISAYDLAQYTTFRSALGTVAQTLTTNLPTLGPAIASAAVMGQKYTYSELTDLITFIDSLSIRTAEPTLLAQLATLRAAAASGFRVDSRARNGTGVGLGIQPDVTRSTGLHVVLPTGLDGDQFFAGGAKSLANYQSLYPGLPWTTFLTAWTTGQATTAFVDQGNARLETYLAWAPEAAATGVDIDLWVVEPSGNLYIPYLGTVTPNGDFTPESAEAGVAYEGWLTRQFLEVGPYAFYANLWSDPSTVQPLVQFFYRNDQVSALTPLYAPGTEPQLSPAASWLADPTPTFGEADGGAYTDLRLVATLNVTPPPAIVAATALRRSDGRRNLRPQVVAGIVGLPEVAGAGIGASFRTSTTELGPRRTVTPAITATQFATAHRLLATRPARRPAPTATIRRLP